MQLSIKRPTGTTVLYTVSTRSPTRTIAARLSSYAVILLRIAIGFLTTVVLLHELSISATFQNSKIFIDLRQSIVTSPFGWLPSILPTLLTTSWRLALEAGVVWLIFRKGYTEESLLVIRGLGVQTNTSSPSWLWSSGGSTRFIPTNVIQDVFLYEAFKGFEVRFYLGIVVEGEEDVVVVFPSTLPRREILEKVWRGAKACLYEPKS